ncbi:MAG: hypothetical protein ACM34O_00370 [Ignavibacteria bacterium]
MKKIIATSLIFVSILFLFNKCSKDENNVGGNGPVIDPITAQWTNTANPDHRFNFTTFDSTVTRGEFFGDEDHPVIGFSELEGFFDKTYVEFDVSRPAGIIKFTGNFVNNNRIDLQSSEGNITITR